MLGIWSASSLYFPNAFSQWRLTRIVWMLDVKFQYCSAMSSPQTVDLYTDSVTVISNFYIEILWYSFRVLSFYYSWIDCLDFRAHETWRSYIKIKPIHVIQSIGNQIKLFYFNLQFNNINSTITHTFTSTICTCIKLD